MNSVRIALIFLVLFSSCSIYTGKPLDEEFDYSIKNWNSHYFWKLNSDGIVTLMESKADTAFPSYNSHTIQLNPIEPNQLQVLYRYSPISYAYFKIEPNEIKLENYGVAEPAEPIEHLWNYSGTHGDYSGTWTKLNINGYSTLQTYLSKVETYKIKVNNGKLEFYDQYSLHSNVLAPNRYRTYSLSGNISGILNSYKILETTYDILYDDEYKLLSLNPIYQEYKYAQIIPDSGFKFLNTVPNGKSSYEVRVLNENFGLVYESGQYWLADTTSVLQLLASYDEPISINSDYLITANKVANLKTGEIKYLPITLETHNYYNSAFVYDDKLWFLSMDLYGFQNNVSVYWTFIHLKTNQYEVFHPKEIQVPLGVAFPRGGWFFKLNGVGYFYQGKMGGV